jgi:hypothetical protein
MVLTPKPFEPFNGSSQFLKKKKGKKGFFPFLVIIQMWGEVVH